MARPLSTMTWRTRVESLMSTPRAAAAFAMAWVIAPMPPIAWPQKATGRVFHLPGENPWRGARRADQADWHAAISLRSEGNRRQLDRNREHGVRDPDHRRRQRRHLGRDEPQLVNGLSQFRGHAFCSNGQEANSGDGGRNLPRAIEREKFLRSRWLQSNADLLPLGKGLGLPLESNFVQPWLYLEGGIQ